MQDGRVVYRVEDNGIGFAPEHRQHVWELFYRRMLMDESEAAGLGLTLVRRIIDRHRGRIALESEQGVGSRFIVTLPASKAEPSQEVS